MTSAPTIYEPREYVPKASLLQLHSSARLLGVNTISTQGLDTVTQMNGHLYNYAIGVVVPAVVMVLIFLIWMCSLCCTRKCCKQKDGNKRVCLIMFVMACSCSILGWVLGLVGNVNVTLGFNAMITGVQSVQGLLQQVINLSDNTTTVNTNLIALANDMDVQCQNSEGVDFPLSSITGALNSAISAANTATGSFLASLQNVNADIDVYVQEVGSYLSWREVGTMIVLVVLIVLISVFMLTTVMREAQWTPGPLKGCVRLSSKSTSCIIFVFGLLFLLIIWVFVALFHVLLTIGADFCAPDVNANVNGLIAEVTFNEFGLQNLCEDTRFTSQIFGSVLCYYQTCEGSSPVGLESGEISDASEQGRDFLNSFKADLLAALPPGNETLFTDCFTSIETYFNETSSVIDLVVDAIGISECRTINPVYAALLYDGACNGVVDGLYFTYVSCILGSVFLMIAMMIFRTFDHPDYYPQAAQVQDNYAGGDANGTLMAATNPGGPVSKGY